MEHINRFIEHTLLRPDINEHQLEEEVSNSIRYSFAGVCVPPCWIKKARSLVGNNDIQVVAPAGFPLGYSLTECKLEEINRLIGDGADEIDLVWNLSYFKTNPSLAELEIARCASLVHESGHILKVIIETCYLSRDEIVKACEICRNSEADFVKTSTGFGPAGASIEDIRLLRSVLPSHIGIKASGGIRDFSTAASMVEAGADRIGTSSGPKIMKEALENIK